MNRGKTVCVFRRLSGILLAASLAVTMGLLFAEGRWRDALPLHLCSLSALAALWLSCRPSALGMDFLWYLGMPGALLALIFPAPAASRAQALLNGAYLLTHLLIVAIPILAMNMGEEPRLRRAGCMLLLLQGIALTALLVNALLGTDYLFLSAPPAGTPLEWVFALGYGVYLLTLEGLMLLVCMGMEALGTRLFAPQRIERA